MLSYNYTKIGFFGLANSVNMHIVKIYSYVNRGLSINGKTPIYYIIRCFVLIE